jgi:hypothetical protein
VKSRVLRPDGTYYRQQPAAGEARHRSQEELMQLTPAVAPAEAPAVAPVNGQPPPLAVDATTATSP